MDIQKQINDVLNKFKGLAYSPSDNIIRGEIFIDKGDSYEVEIELSKYPSFFPTVYEIGGRIPKRVDRHVYPDNGACCFTTTAKSQVLLKTVVKSLVLFIDKILIQYLRNNSYYEIEGNYYGEEHAHTYFGIIEGYQDILGIKDIDRICRIILERIDGKKYSIRDNCYCGCGASLKKCNDGRHNINYRKFKKVSKSVLGNDLGHFKTYFDSVKNST